MKNTKFYTSRSHSLSPNVKRRMSELLAKDKRKINILQTPFLLALPHVSPVSPVPLVSPVPPVPPVSPVPPVPLVSPVPLVPHLCLCGSHSHSSQTSQPSQPSQTSHLFLTDNKQLTHSCKKINVKIFVN